MVKEAARPEFLLTITYFEHYYTRIMKLWVAGEGPTIGWSYLRRKIVREKRLCFRGHGYLIVLKVVACLASWCRGNTFPSPSNV